MQLPNGTCRRRNLTPARHLRGSLPTHSSTSVWPLIKGATRPVTSLARTSRHTHDDVPNSAYELRTNRNGRSDGHDNLVAEGLPCNWTGKRSNPSQKQLLPSSVWGWPDFRRTNSSSR